MRSRKSIIVAHLLSGGLRTVASDRLKETELEDDPPLPLSQFWGTIAARLLVKVCEGITQ